MSERPHYFKLGLFVIITTALLLTGVAILGAGALFKQTFSAETYMEESVQGLDVGAPVKERGVKVGTVRRISFLGDEYSLPSGPEGSLNRQKGYVYIEMELDAGKRGTQERVEVMKAAIKAGMHARMASTGIVGNVYVELFYPREPVPALELTWEPRTLYIPSAKSVIAELTDTASRIARQLESAKLDVVGQDIGSLVRKLDEKLTDLDMQTLQSRAISLVDELRESNHRLQTLLENPSIGSALRSIDESSASLNKLVTDISPDVTTFSKQLPAIAERLRATTDNINALLEDPRTRQILADVSSTAATAPAAAAEVRRFAQRLNTLLASQQSDLETIVADLRRTAENLQKLSSEASRNPSAVIFGEPPPNTPIPGSTPQSAPKERGP